MVKTVILLAVLLSCAISTGWAFGIRSESMKCEFQKDKISPGITWSNNLALTPNGLQLVPQTADERNHSDIWIMSDKITIPGIRQQIRGASIIAYLPQGSYVEPKGLDVYIRYGCDGVHWSNWYNMKLSPKGTPLFDAYLEYTCNIALPHKAYERYYSLMQQWSITYPKNATEYELCNWIAQTNPTFFNEEIPFMGYFQILIEGSPHQALIQEMDLLIYHSTGPGMFHDTDTNINWHFELKQ